MSSKWMWLGMLLSAGVLAVFDRSAQAGNITTSAVACHGASSLDAQDIGYFFGAVGNGNASPRSISCEVARSPVAAGASASFYVDGFNYPGTSVDCTLVSLDFTGNVLGLQSFTKTVSPSGSFTRWDQLVTFTAAQISPWAYVSLACTLPGQGGGGIYGIAAVF